jgi:hypothetical protein
MAERFDTNSVSDDPAYWRKLAKQVAANAVRESRLTGIDWVAHSVVVWIAACLLFAMPSLSMISRSGASLTQTRNAEWSEMLAPGDDIGKAIASPDRPPTIDALLIADPDGV